MHSRRSAHTARYASPGRGRALGALFAIAASIAVAACGSDSTTGPGGSTQKTPDGSYAISTINSSVLPASIASDTGGFNLEILSGTLTLSTNGQYSVVTNFRETLGAILQLYTDSSGGTWTMAAGTNTVQFTDGADGSKDQATWVSGQLTLVDTVDVSVTPLTVVYKLTKQ